VWVATGLFIKTGFTRELWFWKTYVSR